jgi:molybdenum-dependent DNA-binding transcriptional regulator ModE
MDVKTKVWLERDGQFVVGDGGLRLLLGVLEHGSLMRAAREIRWSYRHAWGTCAGRRPRWARRSPSRARARAPREARR